jgi:hypothetical protein
MSPTLARSTGAIGYRSILLGSGWKKDDVKVAQSP